MTTQVKLEGKDLLARAKELSHLKKRNIAIDCGYSTIKNDKVRVDMTGFYDAMLSAKGVSIESTPSDSRGKVASFQATVHKNGQIIIGSTYTKEMGLKEGDIFEIKLGTKNIRLVPKELVAA